MAVDVNLLFARAEHEFSAGMFDRARANLGVVLKYVGENPAVLHLSALVEHRDGRLPQADIFFRRALKVTRSDAQINNNYAILLEALQNRSAAMRHYDAAILLNRDFVDALVNRATLKEQLGSLGSALEDAKRAVALAPRNVSAQTALGSVSYRLDQLDDAAAAFDAALDANPGATRALRGRARVALERGESLASAMYRRLHASGIADHDIILGLASALETEGDPQGVAILAEAVRIEPDWVEGQSELARMRAEAGDRTGAPTGYRHALASRPHDPAMHVAHWRALAQLGLYREALDAIADASRLIALTPDMRQMQAICSDEAGDTAKAEELFATLGGSPDIAVPHARHLLRLGRFDEAAAMLQQHLARLPDDIAAWAHLDLTWRLLGDDRHLWLSGQPGLLGTADLGFGEADLAELANLLRNLHRTRAHPIGQSLRSGTQTRGRLFVRTEPLIRRLHAVLTQAVDGHVARLPEHDPDHPLLRYRNAKFAISGSWSVRLGASGFHVNHIHPAGLLSSACYVSLPRCRDVEGREGWLELGAPPTELGLKLAPLVSIEPTAGTLVLFPSYLFHGTRPFSDGERLTVAFDVTKERGTTAR